LVRLTYASPMSNVYNELAFKPALTKRKMSKKLEGMARRLVDSGRMRIDTIVDANFVRFYRPYEGINMAFSYSEILSERLIPRTMDTMRMVLARNYSGSALEKKVEEELQRLQKETEKR